MDKCVKYVNLIVNLSVIFVNMHDCVHLSWLYVFPAFSTSHYSCLSSPASQCLFTLQRLIYDLLLLFLSDIVEYCRLWLPLQTPCHFVPCNVTIEPPWGPYIHFNWFGKDLAAFELKRVREESGEWGRAMERKSKKNRRGGDSVCVDGCVLFWQFFVIPHSVQKNTHTKKCCDNTDILKQYLFCSWINNIDMLSNAHRM